MKGVVLLFVGGLSAAARVAMARTGIQGVPIGRAHSICVSGAGQYAQLLSAKAASVCAHVSDIWTVLAVVTVAAVACIAGGIVLLVMRIKETDD